MDRPPRDPTLVLAPIRGVTDGAFREVFARWLGGLDRAVAPFVVEQPPGRLRPGPLRDLHPSRSPGLAVEPQILGKAPDRFLALAGAFAAMGHDRVSWNLGCPSPPTLSRGRGAALLARPAEVAAFLESVVPRLPCRLSIKARLGLESETELPALMPVLSRYPLAELVIHPRTVGDGFDGPLRLEAFEACLAASAAPVAWSGEIWTAARLEELRSRFPAVSAWMLGRGILADPWLARRVREGFAGADLDALRSFHEALVLRYRESLSGPTPVLARLAALWGWLGPSFEGGSKLHKALRKARGVERAEEAVRRFLDGRPRWLGPRPRPTGR